MTAPAQQPVPVCAFCQTHPVDDDASGLCLDCLVDRERDAHEQACLAHYRRGGSYDTRPVFVHPTWRLLDPAAEAPARSERWTEALRQLPELGGSLFRAEKKS